MGTWTLELSWQSTAKPRKVNPGTWSWDQSERNKSKRGYLETLSGPCKNCKTKRGNLGTWNWDQSEKQEQERPPRKLELA